MMVQQQHLQQMQLNMLEKDHVVKELQSENSVLSKLLGVIQGAARDRRVAAIIKSTD